MEILQRTEPNSGESKQLVERMDSAIGEASTSIGMIMSELVRRSLRGGVGDIGTSIQDYARDQVGAAIEEVMPELKNTVTILAESTSVRITDVAVNRIGEDLKAIESRTSEQTQVFAARLKADSEAALEVVHRAIGESRDTTESTVRDLKELQVRARESWKKVQLELQNGNDARVRLETQLSETQSDLNTTREKMTELHQKLEQSQHHQAETRERLEKTALHLTETQKLLKATQQELARTRQEFAVTAGHLEELRQSSAQKSREIESVCSGLEKRLEELERPRGIRALFSRIKGGKKPLQTDTESDRENA